MRGDAEGRGALGAVIAGMAAAPLAAGATLVAGGGLGLAALAYAGGGGAGLLAFAALGLSRGVRRSRLRAALAEPQARPARSYRLG